MMNILFDISHIRIIFQKGIKSSCKGGTYNEK